MFSQLQDTKGWTSVHQSSFDDIHDMIFQVHIYIYIYMYIQYFDCMISQMNDSGGWTPLHYACEAGYPLVVEVYICHCVSLSLSISPTLSPSKV